MFILTIGAYSSIDKQNYYVNQYENSHQNCVEILKNLSRKEAIYINERCQYEEKREKSILDERLTDATDSLATYTKFLFFSTLLLAIVTGMLVIFAVRQSKDTRASLQIASENAKAATDTAQAVAKQAEYSTASGRAHLRVVDFSIAVDQSMFDNVFPPGTSNVGGYINYSFKIKNFGSSPADIFNVAWGAGCVVAAEEIVPLAIETGQRTVGAEEMSDSYIGKCVVTFELFKHTQLVRRQRYMFLAVDVIYYDVFGELQNETVYWRYDNPRGGQRYPFIDLVDRRKLTDRQS